VANKNDKNLPRYWARANAASFPEGKSMPNNKSIISNLSPLRRFAEVPYIIDAYL
jgi:hypothetical protein